MAHHGDIATQQTLYFMFSTNAAGVPTTLAGTPALSVYKDDSVTQTTTGVTLTVDLDSVTGLHSVKIVTTDAFYAVGHDYSVVITTGTVGGVSAVGYVVGAFSIENRSALRPTTAGRTLDVASTGEAGLDFDNVKDATGAHTLANITVPVVTTTGTATNLTNNHAKYMHGAVWIDTVNGATGTVSYTNGIMTNPSSSLAEAKSIGDNLKLKRFWVQAGSTLTLGADYLGYVFDGRGWILALGTRDISKCQFERIEGLSGTATCATGEAVFIECHVNTVTIGEADFNRCHLNGTITMSQAAVPYLFHSCAGIGTLAKITFAAATQSCVIAKWSGALIIAGMVTGDTLFLDGNGDVTFDNTNTGGTVYISGNIKLTNNGTLTSLVDTSRYDEDQNITNVTGTVNALATQAKADVNAEVDTAITDAALATAANIAALHDFNPSADVVAHVTLVDTTTTNTDMVADAPLAADNAAAVLAAAAVTPIAANIKKVNNVTIQGTGAVGTDEWRKT
jgi:hypothetical protein